MLLKKGEDNPAATALLNYLKGAPVILAISVYYAWHVGFSVFWNV